MTRIRVDLGAELEPEVRAWANRAGIPLVHATRALIRMALDATHGQPVGPVGTCQPHNGAQQAPVRHLPAPSTRSDLSTPPSPPLGGEGEDQVLDPRTWSLGQAELDQLGELVAGGGLTPTRASIAAQVIQFRRAKGGQIPVVQDLLALDPELPAPATATAEPPPALATDPDSVARMERDAIRVLAGAKPDPFRRGVLLARLEGVARGELARLDREAADHVRAMVNPPTPRTPAERQAALANPPPDLVHAAHVAHDASRRIATAEALGQAPKPEDLRRVSEALAAITQAKEQQA